MILLHEGLVTAARALVVAAVAACGACFVCASLRQASLRTRRVISAALAITLLTPVILPGYAYSNVTVSLIHSPRITELFYCILLCLRVMPVAVAALCFAPVRLSPTAVHVYMLGRSETGLRRWMAATIFRLRNGDAPWLLPAALTFILAFADFEMPSLMGIRSWTVVLFDAQATGISLQASLLMSLFPLVTTIAVIAPVMIWLHARSREAVPVPAAGKVRGAAIVTGGILAAGILSLSVVPAVIVLRGALDGFGVMLENFALGKEVAASLIFALSAAILSFTGAWSITRTRKATLMLLPALPGLLGSLLLALICLALFQGKGLSVFYDTPVPLALCLSLLLMPYALPLFLLRRKAQAGTALFLPRLMQAGDSPHQHRAARRIRWHLEWEPVFWIFVVLFYLAYYELTASTILAPAGMTTAFSRLYNLMHYEQSAVLSAMVCTTVFLPPLLLMPAWGIWRAAVRLRASSVRLRSITPTATCG